MSKAKRPMPQAKRPMSCDEFDALLDIGDPLRVSEGARLHVKGCARCQALVQALSGAVSEPLPSSALARAEAAAARDLTPVHSLRSPLGVAIGTMLVLACLLLVGVLVLGSRGWAGRLPWQRAASYLGAGSVLVLSLATALREREPGLSLLAPWRYAVAALATLVWVGPFVLYGFRPETKFLKHGALCSCIGLVVGLAAGVVIWLVMRRGYLLSPLRAGWFAGIAAGCVGFMLQEAYCPVVESGHSALWHGGVVALLGISGLIVGWKMLRDD